MGEPALHRVAEGRGPLVVLGHGFGGSARNWRPQQRALRERYRVVAFDLRGHARSEAPPDAASYRPARFRADLGRILDAEGAAHAVLGGLSLGAWLALDFALAHPARVRGLVLASFPAEGGFGAVAEPFAAAIEREGLEAAGERFVWGPASGLGAAGAALVRQGFLEHPPHALAATLRGLLAALPGPQALAPRLAGLAVPALVVAGERDAGSLAASRRLAESLPAARLEVIPDAGHVVNLERPDAFNALLVGFLGSLPPAPAASPG